MQEAKNLGGRPAYVHGKRRNVYLDDATMNRAKEIGGGNASEGIREAIEQFYPMWKERVTDGAA